ncbi:MAG: hypothetical protein WC860_06645 [Candidatus Margulisiibacteriota bacterium]|jgi:hypothetical protein
MAKNVDSNNKINNALFLKDEVSAEFYKPLTDKEIPTLEVDLTDRTDIIQKDINMIVLPFFYFGSKKQFAVIRYYFNRDKSKQMLIEAASRKYAPTAFDYEVTQVLLKFREVMKKQYPEQEGFYCTVWNIAKEMGLLCKNKKGNLGLSLNTKNRIIDSIERLKKTSYELINLYNVKEIKNGLPFYTKEEKIHINILTELRSSDNKNKEDNKTIFYIKFSDVFLRSIHNKYHFTYELAKLDQISSPVAKRLFEIIDFRRNQKLEAVFSYKEISSSIPLNSGRMNRVFINNYLKQLKDEAKVIKDFIADYQVGYFQVKFVKDTKYRQAFLEGFDASIPSSTQIELFEQEEYEVNEKSAEKEEPIITEEAEQVISEYVKIMRESGKIKSNYAGYEHAVKIRVAEDIKNLDAIKRTVGDFQKKDEQKLQQKKMIKEFEEKLLSQEGLENKQPEAKLLTKEDFNRIKDTVFITKNK